MVQLSLSVLTLCTFGQGNFSTPPELSRLAHQEVVSVQQGNSSLVQFGTAIFAFGRSSFILRSSRAKFSSTSSLTPSGNDSDLQGPPAELTPFAGYPAIPQSSHVAEKYLLASRNARQTNQSLYAQNSMDIHCPLRRTRCNPKGFLVSSESTETCRLLLAW
ncbi:hypothetical protein B0J14DRAFT_357616 [Halenospora varia]|nr:hypothetical protein B0J14DRAFT_357616 [Halenospora varia]